MKYFKEKRFGTLRLEKDKELARKASREYKSQQLAKLGKIAEII